MVAPVVEEQMLALDGAIIDVEITAISFHSGEHMDIQVLARDLTERKIAERHRHALLEREMEASRYYRSLFESAPGAYLVLTPHDHRIVAVSEAYLRVTLTRREELMGAGLFEAFPDDPQHPDAESTLRLRQSLERVVRDKRADVMPVHCFPIRKPLQHGGEFEVRYWSLVNSPVLGPDGAVAFIIHRAEDVTAYVTQRLGQGGVAGATK
jgi:PAS domain S-box-containing protein